MQQGSLLKLWQEYIKEYKKLEDKMMSLTDNFIKKTDEILREEVIKQIKEKLKK